jgi:hypothetical protein
VISPRALTRDFVVSRTETVHAVRGISLDVEPGELVYLSVMNYSFQLGGVIKADGSKYWGYSNVQPTSINEARPAETVGLGSLGAGYRTSWKCPNGSTRTTAGAANRPIDWNCDTTDTTTAADINGDKTTSILIAHNNWANIVVFGGGAVGGGTTPRTKTPASELHEITHDEWLSMHP